MLSIVRFIKFLIKFCHPVCVSLAIAHSDTDEITCSLLSSRLVITHILYYLILADGHISSN
jgi:hypothetical protein